MAGPNKKTNNRNATAREAWEQRKKANNASRGFQVHTGIEWIRTHDKQQFPPRTGRNA